MRRTRIMSALAAAAIAAVSLAACSGGSTPDGGAGGTGDGSKDPIYVAVMGGVSAEGVLANNSATSITAAQASVAAVNAAGGIDGRQVEISVIDDQGDPTVAVTKLREAMAGKNKPVVVMNSGPSTVVDATLPILGQNKVLSFNIGPTATSPDPKKNPLNFDLSPSAGDYIKAFIPTIKERGYKKVAIVHGSSAYGELFGKSAGEQFAAAGLEVTGNQGFDNAALDMTAQLEALKAGNPDVLVMDAYGAPLGYVLQGIEKLGWDVPIMGNNSVAATILIATEPPTGVLGTDQVKNLTMQVFKSTKYDAAATATNEAVDLMAKTGPIKSSLIPAYNYDSMLLVRAAAEKAGSLDTTALAKALEDPEVQKAAKTIMLTQYNFTAEAHSPSPAASEFQFISPGPLVNGQFH